MSLIYLPFQKSDVIGTADPDVFVCDSGTFIPQTGYTLVYSAGHLGRGYHIAGGDGYDTIDLNADTSLVFGRETISGIEEFTLDTDARIGNGPGHAYDFTMNDANVAAGERLFIDGVYSTSFSFDGSAESNGAFDVTGGFGVNTFRGGAGADNFLLNHGGGSVDAGGGDDLVLVGGERGDGKRDPSFADGGLQGGSGIDTLWLWGRVHLKMHEFDAATSGFENLQGPSDITGDKHANALDFSGFAVLSPDDLLITHGKDGDDTLTGWSADNALFGDAGNDRLTGGDARNIFNGGAGADIITAGAGEDIVAYGNATDSSGDQIDTIHHFDFAHDRFDVRHLVSMVSIGSGHLYSGEAQLLTPDPDHPGAMEIVIDQNGQWGYQAGEDLLIRLVHPLNTDHFGVDDFI